MSEPSLLSYERSIHPTDGVFLTEVGGGLVPVSVSSKTTLGTQSQFSKDGKVPAHGNPQRIEVATLPHEACILVIEFGVTVTASALTPHSCDEPEWRKMLQEAAAAYVEADGFKTLGRRYAANIANGRWAWKNRVFASIFEVTVTVIEGAGDASGKEFRFDALSLPMRDLEDGAYVAAGAVELGDLIAEALAGKGRLKLAVSGRLDVGAGAQVYPSQEFAERDDDPKAVGKVLFGIPCRGIDRCAALHEQKIGNAIRTVDSWHEGIEGHVEAGQLLPVNPYGQSRAEHVVVREAKSGNADFYTVLKKQLKTMPADMASGGASGSVHFVMANLVRGGVYGMGKKAK